MDAKVICAFTYDTGVQFAEYQLVYQAKNQNEERTAPVNPDLL